MTRISPERAPVVGKIEKVFGKGAADGMYLAYDHTIYTNGSSFVPEDLIYHEEVHFRQQDEFDGTVDEWWDVYLQDPKFRFKAELEAYGEQVRKFTKPNTEQRTRMLDYAARAMTGKAYGGMVTFIDARNQLKEYVR